jgi:hypothetical protein
MPNEFLPKLKVFKDRYKEVKKLENELTDDDIIALLDKHLQVETIPEKEELSPEEKDDDRSINDQVTENDEIEKISQSQIDKKMEELNNYIADKKKEVDTIIKRIKRKEPPSGDISDAALSTNAKIKANWFEVDV